MSNISVVHKVIEMRSIDYEALRIAIGEDAALRLQATWANSEPIFIKSFNEKQRMMADVDSAWIRKQTLAAFFAPALPELLMPRWRRIKRWCKYRCYDLADYPRVAWQRVTGR